MKLSKHSLALLLLTSASASQAALITNPNDVRTWQGATVGTFAQLYYGSNTLANRQLVVDNHLLDDGIFDTSTGIEANLIKCIGCSGSAGYSTDSTGTGSYGYGIGGDVIVGGSHIDNLWVQTGNGVGNAVWDLGTSASKAAIFNTIDHGPLPLEAIESTVYLSNDMVNWTQAVTERVWLEGFKSNTGILWDGFTYSVGTANNSAFRYASIIWGGAGALQADGDNEINGVMAIGNDFHPITTAPEPSALVLLTLGLMGIAFRTKTSKK